MLNRSSRTMHFLDNEITNNIESNKSDKAEYKAFTY